MRPKACFGVDLVLAYGAAHLLTAPEGKQPCPPFGAVQHTFSVPFLVVTIPALIEWVRLRHDFLKSNDFRIGCVFQRQITRLLSGFRFAEFRRKRPSPVADVMPIPSGNPSTALLLVSALCPLPQAVEDLIVYP